MMPAAHPQLSEIGTPARAVNALWLRALEGSAAITNEPNRTLAVLVEEMAAERGDAPALIGDDESLSYRALADRAGQYAGWARAQGLAKGDVVALAMPNRPELVAAWLGLTRVGVVAALLNTHLAGAALAHCIAAAGAKLVIADEELRPVAEAAAGLLQRPVNVLPLPSRCVEPIVAPLADPIPAIEAGGVSIHDPALLIFTSGTTGLPKAAYVSHYRVMAWARWFAALMEVVPADRLYNCLPMYHSVGGVAAVGAMLAGGGSVVIARRFSASRFWDDVVSHDCTLFQYIGELARYLVNTSPSDSERRHKLRLCCGNGLAKDVWEKFQARFAIPRILEFYAATEGNFSLYNVEGKAGSIGRIPAYLAPRMAVEIIQVDAVTGLPVRDGAGRCVKCAADEAGEAIARISASRANPAGRFEGYTSAADTQRKVLADCFEPGDTWLRSGDLMRRDKAGFFYFLDRLGDTFRWKGENVATTEVAQVISGCAGVREANVYGVAVPGHEGRAGMMALVVDEGFDLSRLHAHVAERLPAYARPLFLRVSQGLTATATFKQVKGELAREGFDPEIVSDPLYFDDVARGEYVALDATLHAGIVSGAVRV
jgi:fatty-acyl-CoA synthase